MVEQQQTAAKRSAIDIQAADRTQAKDVPLDTPNIVLRRARHSTGSNSFSVPRFIVDAVQRGTVRTRKELRELVDKYAPPLDSFTPGTMVHTYSRSQPDGAYRYEIVASQGDIHSLHDDAIIAGKAPSSESSSQTMTHDQQLGKRFEPDLSPADMMKRGTMDGVFVSDSLLELPREWLSGALDADKLPVPGSTGGVGHNAYAASVRLSLQQWKLHNLPFWADIDPYGWTQWYFRYSLGRRIPDMDSAMIELWLQAREQLLPEKFGASASSARRAQSRNVLGTIDVRGLSKKQRMQCLLDWAIDPEPFADLFSEVPEDTDSQRERVAEAHGRMAFDNFLHPSPAVISGGTAGEAAAASAPSGSVGKQSLTGADQRLGTTTTMVDRDDSMRVLSSSTNVQAERRSALFQSSGDKMDETK